MKPVTEEDMKRLKLLELACSEMRLKFDLLGVVVIAIDSHQRVALLGDVEPGLTACVPEMMVELSAQFEERACSESAESRSH